MTEEEAKYKYCPIPTQALRGSGGWSANRDFNGRPLCRCIASQCMMWQWIYVSIPSIVEVKQPDKRTEHGHCGLIKS